MKPSVHHMVISTPSSLISFGEEHREVRTARWSFSSQLHKVVGNPHVLPELADGAGLEQAVEGQVCKHFLHQILWQHCPQWSIIGMSWRITVWYLVQALYLFGYFHCCCCLSSTQLGIELHTALFLPIHCSGSDQFVQHFKAFRLQLVEADCLTPDERSYSCRLNLKISITRFWQLKARCFTTLAVEHPSPPSIKLFWSFPTISSFSKLVKPL